MGNPKSCNKSGRFGFSKRRTMKKAWPPGLGEAETCGRSGSSHVPAGEKTGRRLARTARSRADADCSDRSEAASHPVRLSFGSDTLGMPRAKWPPEGVTQRNEVAPRDGASLPWFGLRRARSARLRPSALGLHERSTADEAGAVEAKPCGRRARPFVARLLPTYLGLANRFSEMSVAGECTPYVGRRLLSTYRCFTRRPRGRA